MSRYGLRRVRKQKFSTCIKSGITLDRCYSVSVSAPQDTATKFAQSNLRFQQILATKFSKKNHSELIQKVAKQLEVKTLDDWYNITYHKFCSAEGGQTLLAKYGNSLTKLLRENFPNHTWIPWKFVAVGPNFWSDRKNISNFLKYAAQELEIEHMDDWHKVTAEQFGKVGGSGLLQRYKGSLFALLSDAFPQHVWKPWKFSQVPRGFYNNQSNVVMLVKLLEKELGITELDQWYAVSTANITNVCGGELLRRHGDSLYKLLRKVYPEHSWKPWNFQKAPGGFWDSQEGIYCGSKINEQGLESYVKWLEEQLHITSLTDWYDVSAKDIIYHFNGKTALHKYGGLKQILKTVYPDHNWDLGMFDVPQRKPSKSQTYLTKVVSRIFPKSEILVDYRHPQFQSKFELDIFLPQYQVALEYQGEYHYVTNFVLGDTQDVQRRDSEKKELCEKLGITIIPVPYWWNRQESSLRATIRQFRPDLLSESNGQAIPQEPPKRLKAVPASSPAPSKAPYEVIIGAGNGKCRGCGAPLERKQPRVRAVSHFILKGSMTRTFFAFFCLNNTCIPNAIASSKSVKYPPFVGELAVQKNIAQDPQLAQVIKQPIDGIQFTIF